MEAGKANDNLSELIAAAAAEVGVPLAAAQLAQLATHFRLLRQWNAKINLTAVRDAREIATRHFGESLFLSTLLPAPRGSFVDVGSGAGFPGVPLQVVWPEASAVLLEANQKKATFLKEVIRQCGLPRASVLDSRLEDAARGEQAGSATLVTLRAVAVSEDVLSDLAALLQPGGKVALFLGEADARKLCSADGWHWQEPRAIPHGERRVILIGSR